MGDHQILGIGSPILDHLLSVSDLYLNSVPGQKYGMEPVSYNALIDLIENSGSIPKQKAGGSAANTIKGLSALGWRCAFHGKVGKDPISEKIHEDLLLYNVSPYFCYSASPTSHVLCLITPDGKRTCRSFMGAGAELGPDDLDPLLFENTRLVHIEGYSLLAPGLTHAAMGLAKNAGSLISFDLASFEIVNTYKDLIQQLLRDYVDVVFANEDESFALTGHPPLEACKIISEKCAVAVVMLGKEGCCVAQGKKVSHFPAYPVDPIDTTGAGDLFASGFLHGFLQGKSLAECAHNGAVTGGTVVQYIGAEIPLDKWPEIKMRLK